jgi:hypothetical protein
MNPSISSGRLPDSWGSGLGPVHMPLCSPTTPVRARWDRGGRGRLTGMAKGEPEVAVIESGLMGEGIVAGSGTGSSLGRSRDVSQGKVFQTMEEMELTVSIP